MSLILVPLLFTSKKKFLKRFSSILSTLLRLIFLYGNCFHDLDYQYTNFLSSCHISYLVRRTTHTALHCITCRNISPARPKIVLPILFAAAYYSTDWYHLSRYACFIVFPFIFQNTNGMERCRKYRSQ